MIVDVRLQFMFVYVVALFFLFIFFLSLYRSYSLCVCLSVLLFNFVQIVSNPMTQNFYLSFMYLKITTIRFIDTRLCFLSLSLALVFSISLFDRQPGQMEHTRLAEFVTLQQDKMCKRERDRERKRHCMQFIWHGTSLHLSMPLKMLSLAFCL